jgi:anti-anti-sigma factor
MKHSITVLTPRGRLDAAGVRPFESEMQTHLDAGRVHLLVDMSQVAYVSSIGLRMFLTIMRGARRRGGSLRLYQLNPRVMEIFQLAGFDRVLHISTTREQAENAFTSGDV